MSSMGMISNVSEASVIKIGGIKNVEEMNGKEMTNILRRETEPKS